MSEKTAIIQRRFVSVLVLISLMIVFGCAPKATTIQKEIRGSIEKNGDWKMAEKCGYDECEPLVDFLIGKEMTMRVEFDNDVKTKQFMMIRTEFTAVKKEGKYKPSNIVLKMSNGETLKPKIFSCFYTIWDLEYLRTRSSLEGSYPLNKLDCYLLFFDHAALTDREEAVMDMTGVFTIGGKTLDVPLIRFKKK